MSRLTAVDRTADAILTHWRGDNGRINQGVAFIKRALKSDERRKREKAARKAQRGKR